MDQKYSSFWGNINYIGLRGTGTAKIAISGHEITVRDGDPGLSFLHVTSGAKKTFMIFDEVMTGLHRIVAIYNHPKSTQRLVLGVREDMESGRMEVWDFGNWDPDYLVKPVQ